MPITFVLVCLFFLGLVSLVPAAPITLILFICKRRLHALVALSIPAGMMVLSVLLIVMLFVTEELHSRVTSAQPNRLFETTFGFKPDPQTQVLASYHRMGMDSATTAMEFRTTSTVIERIVAGRFALANRETFVRAYGGDRSNLAEQVRSWFLPTVEQADHFYIATPFDDSFSTHNEAILCYSEKTGIACFHWLGID